MWPESSSVKAVNLVKKSVTITEVMNFSQGVCFLLAHPVDGVVRLRACWSVAVAWTFFVVFGVFEIVYTYCFRTNCFLLSSG